MKKLLILFTLLANVAFAQIQIDDLNSSRIVISGSGYSSAEKTEIIPNASYGIDVFDSLGGNTMYMNIYGILTHSIDVDRIYGPTEVSGDMNILPGGTLSGNGAGLTNVPCTTTGLSITQNVVLWLTSVTNQFAYTNVFSNGLLVASGPVAPPAHASSLIIPGGGYLIQPGGSTILLP